MLLPGEMTVAQRRLLKWFDKLHIHPRIVGEFDDSALMKAFGQAGAGVFIAPRRLLLRLKKSMGWLTSGRQMKCASSSTLFLWSARFLILQSPRLQRLLVSGYFEICHNHLNEKTTGRKHEQRRQNVSSVYSKGCF